MDRSFVRVAPFSVTIGKTKHRLDTLPAYCPRCRQDVVPTVEMGGAWAGPWDEAPYEATLNIAVSCPACDRAYIVEYDATLDPEEERDWLFSLSGTIPAGLRATVISATMKRISSDFARAYDQAVAAQAAGLEELAGAGYRRALEYLVKDYLIYKAPQHEDKYLKTALGNCIKDHINDAAIRELAGRAVSIGNDYVHYRQFNRRDVRQLKSLIDLVHRWIDLNETIASVRNQLETEE